MAAHKDKVGTSETPSPGGLKVFISYSRSEVAFADELELALRDKGHTPLIDRQGIDGGEHWQRRLGELILACDAVVFVLSDTSAVSQTCHWEVTQAAGLSKKILVVTLSDVAGAVSAPPALAGINWIHCWRNPAVPGSSQTKGFLELDRNLRTDSAWRRQQTVLQELAARWTSRGSQPESPLLLRGDLMAEALDWAGKAPGLLPVPEDVATFMAASEAYEARLRAAAEAGLAEREAALTQASAALRKQQRAERGLRRLGLASLLAGVLLFSGAGAASWYAARYYVEAREVQASVIADAASDYSQRGDDHRALELVLMADPSASGGIAERLFRADGFPGARAALERIWFNNETVSIFAVPEPPEATATAQEASSKLIFSLNPRPLEPRRAVSSDGQRYAIGYIDGLLEVFDMRTGRLIWSARDNASQIRAVAFVRENERIFAAKADGVIENRDARGELSGMIRLSGRPDQIAVSRDGGAAVIALENGEVHTWDVSSTTVTRLAVSSTPLDRPCGLAISGDGRRVARASREGTLLVWDLYGNREPRQIQARAPAKPAQEPFDAFSELGAFDVSTAGFRGLGNLAEVVEGDRLLNPGGEPVPEAISYECPLSISQTGDYIFTLTASPEHIGLIVLSPPAGPPQTETKSSQDLASETGQAENRFQEDSSVKVTRTVPVPAPVLSFNFDDTTRELRIAFQDGATGRLEFGAMGFEWTGRWQPLLPASHFEGAVDPAVATASGSVQLVLPDDGRARVIVRAGRPPVELVATRETGCRQVGGIDVAGSGSVELYCTDLAGKVPESGIAPVRKSVPAGGYENAEASVFFVHRPDFLAGPGARLLNRYEEPSAPSVVDMDTVFGPVRFEFSTILKQVDGLNAVAYAPDYTRAVTLSVKGELLLWTSGKGQPLRLTQNTGIPDDKAVSFTREIPIAFDRDGGAFLVLRDEDELEYWTLDSAPKKVIQSIENCGVSSIGAHVDPGSFFVGCSGGQLIRLDPVTGDILQSVELGSPVRAVIHSVNGRQVFAAKPGGEISIVDSETFQEIWRGQLIEEEIVNLAIGPGGSVLTLSDETGAVSQFKVDDFLLSSAEIQFERACEQLAHLGPAGMRPQDLAGFPFLRGLSEPCRKAAG